MKIDVQTTVQVQAEDFVDQLTLDDFCSLVEAATAKFDKDFVGRARVAQAMSEGLSESGCRLLAEVVTQHYFRH